MSKNEIYTDLENNSDVDGTDKDGALYNFVFHYNHHTKLWNAIPRESYLGYWGNIADRSILKSKSFSTLIEIIQRTNGNPSLIDQLTREQ